MSGYMWSDKEDAVLLKAIERREAWDKIGQRLGRTEQAARRRAIRLGIKPLHEPVVRGNLTRREQEIMEYEARIQKSRDDAFVRRVIREAIASGLVKRPQSHPQVKKLLGTGELSPVETAWTSEIIGA